MVMGARIDDPVGAFQYLVEINGLVVAGFTEVSGLQSQMEVMEYREGGLNTFTHRLPVKTVNSPVVLKRGMSPFLMMWDWYADFMSGQGARAHVTILMQGLSGLPVCAWLLKNAYPTKWTGPTLNAASSDVAIESLELVYEDIQFYSANTAHPFSK